jgi:hypothetical protein
MLIFPNIKEHTRQLQNAVDRKTKSKDSAKRKVSTIRTGDGETAAMSYVHMLAIPKKRIYSAVSLAKEDVPLVRRIMAKAAETLKKQSTIDYYLGQRDLDLSESVFDETQLDLFHPHPSHSVGTFTRALLPAESLDQERGDISIEKSSCQACFGGGE